MFQTSDGADENFWLIFLFLTQFFRGKVRKFLLLSDNFCFCVSKIEQKQENRSKNNPQFSLLREISRIFSNFHVEKKKFRFYIFRCAVEVYIFFSVLIFCLCLSEHENCLIRSFLFCSAGKVMQLNIQMRMAFHLMRLQSWRWRCNTLKKYSYK